MTRYSKIITAILCLCCTIEVYAQDTLKIKVDSLDKEHIAKLVSGISKENAELREKLTKLETTINSTNAITVLKDANVERYKTYVNNLNSRHQAGEIVIMHIIREINQFSLSYSQLLLQSEFSSLSNPTKFKTFNSSMQQSFEGLKKRKMLPSSEDVSQIGKVIPMIDKAPISSIVSVVSYFLDKYNKKKELRSDIFNKLNCVLNFTSKVDGEYQIYIFRVTELNTKINTYKDNIKKFYSLYLNSINYNGGYEQYVKDKKNIASDFMKKRRDDFFGKLTSETTSIGIVNYETSSDDDVLYNIEQVKYYLTEYENLLIEINDNINKYEDFVANLKEFNKSLCPDLQEETSKSFDDILKKIKVVKDNFKIVYEENRIDANTKRILFGF
jgi:hypothetical protein